MRPPVVRNVIVALDSVKVSEREHNPSNQPMRFSKKLIKEYGEQTYRDSLRTNHDFESSAICSVEVAAACGFIRDTEKTKQAFQDALVEFARNFEPPASWC